MSRYQPLADFLTRQKGDQWDATFDEIEACLGFRLPNSAYRYPAWWANQRGSGHSQTAGWQAAGWRTTALDLERRRVRFEREPGPRAEQSLIVQAQNLTGIRDRKQLIDEGLKALIAREAGATLARLGGTMPSFRAPGRERPAE